MRTRARSLSETVVELITPAAPRVCVSRENRTELTRLASFYFVIMAVGARARMQWDGERQRERGIYTAHGAVKKALNFNADFQASKFWAFSCL